jgi:hypothetical protein
MNRAFSRLTVRTLNDEQRLIEGIATAPRPDRVGDIVEPRGAVFELPLPFLLDHNHLEAVGEVERAEVTADGIKFVARIKKIAEPGQVKDLVDRAWHLVKHGLRRTVSIGFNPLDGEQIPSGGFRFKSWEWLELSAVTVPAHPEARITGVKASRQAPFHAGAQSGLAHVVKLSDGDLRMGRLLADAQKRAEARARLGIDVHSGRPVRLDGRGR